MVGVTIFLLLISYSGLKSPKVQTYITKNLAEKLSEELNTEVTIESVDIKLIKTIVLEGVLIKDLHKDTLLYVNYFSLNVSNYNLDSNYFNISDVELTNTAFYLKKYLGEDELNLQFIIDHFALEDTAKASLRWLIDGENLLLDNIHFKYHDENSIDTINSGINFKDLDLIVSNGSFHKMHVIGDTLIGKIENLNVTEKSGFEINKFTAMTSISSVHAAIDELHLITNSSEIIGDLNFSYKKYEDYSNFINEIQIESHLDSTKLNLSDIAYFVPVLNGADQEVIISSAFKGSINSFILSDLDIAFEKYTKITAEIEVAGLPDINSTFIHFDDAKIKTHYSDLEEVQVPPYNQAKYLELPNELKKLGMFSFDGDYKGLISEFELNGKLNSLLGTVVAKMRYTENIEKGVNYYNGRVYAIDFDVGKLIENSDIGPVTLDVDLSGSGFNPEDIQANLLGEIKSIELLNYVYSDIELEGEISNSRFNGYTVVDDKNAFLRFDGVVDFETKLPKFQFVANVQNANLSALNIASDSCNCNISTFITADFKANSIDDIEGYIGVYKTDYQQKDKQMVIADIELFASRDSVARKLKLVSDMVNGEIAGTFKMVDITQSVSHMVYQSLPTLFNEEVKSPDSVYFSYEFEVANTQEATDIFLPSLDIIEPLNISGNLDSRDSSFVHTVTSNQLQYSNAIINNFSSEVLSDSGVLKANITSDKILIGDSLIFLNYQFFTKGVDNRFLFETSFDNQDSALNYASIDGMLLCESSSKFNFGLTNSDVSLDGLHWRLKENNSVEIDSTSISVKNFQLQNALQKLTIDGKITENPEDKILLLAENVKLETFDKFYKGIGLSLFGIANGNAVFSDPYNELIFSADLNLKELVVNGDSLLTGNINARWIAEDRVIKTNGDFGKEFAFTGSYNPKSKIENLDIILSMKKLGLKKFEPFVRGILSDIKGDLSGALKIQGTLSDPKVKGTLNLIDAGINVDYLNTYYTLRNEFITIEEDWFGFDIITIEDRHGGTAKATGTIIHEGFKNMNFDIAVFPKFFESLHTVAEDNPVYYGDAYISGVVNVSGYAETMKMDINVRTEKGTDLYIPLDGSKEYSEIDYIKFVIKDSTLLSEKEEYKVDLDGMEMTFDLEVTPEAKMEIIFDEDVGDIIKTQGQGQIKMEISPSGDFNIYGNYEITDGDYLFTLENVINKKFLVASGSTISFDGDPLEAVLDVTAIYKLKASLKDLGISSLDTTGKRVAVDCHLKMKESLSNPKIAFDIDLPNSTEKTNTDFKTAINSNSSMNKQMFSLLIINRFVPLTDRGGFNAGGAGSSTSTELLSSQLSNWLSQISDDFDVGVNYRAGNEVAASEVEVALSTQLFNDRITVETNVGVTGENSSSSNSSGIAGDFDLEYKISKDGKMRARVYSESNDYNDVTTNNIKYTQGIGLFYTVEFDSFGKFFRNMFGKKKE